MEFNEKAARIYLQCLIDNNHFEPYKINIRFLYHEYYNERYIKIVILYDTDDMGRNFNYGLSHTKERMISVVTKFERDNKIKLLLD